ncbi:dCTP deaminase [Dubosiella newyorkensis]|uniref:dCTP deaminase n=1 Tax=Dubosiella newyorkensis TaxID=1862672 RepID=UPI00248BD614|nr:hypothetical protein [Dubosiella newyorkensis]
MILVDKNIKELGSSVIIKGYREENVHAISYDVTLDKILTNEGELSTYTLPSQETVYIKTKEEILVPKDLMIQVGQRNSLMRLGLYVDAPNYQPGHQTYMFLRVQNISANPIELREGDRIAQLLFWELKEIPSCPYNKQKSASFNLEKEYVQFGNYQEEYQKRIHKIEKASESLETTESRIYGNILTLMGIFVSIFSLVMVNFSAFSKGSPDLKTIYTMNGSLLFIISFLICLIFILLNLKFLKNHIKTLGICLGIYCLLFFGFIISLFYL